MTSRRYRRAMLVGLMNHPARPIGDEIREIGERGFEFVDLTLEPPLAWPADGRAVAAVLAESGLHAVGHTAYFLPIASPFQELRAQAHRLICAALDVFAEAGIKLVNVHPDPMTKLFSFDEVVRRNAEAIAELAENAAARGLELMVENLPRSFARPEELAPILEADEKLGFHLDVGHANLGLGRGEPNLARALIDAFRERLRHVHVSDNVGVDDLHLPLGAGTIDWGETARLLRAAGWDGTVTLEVFSASAAHADTSRQLWLEWWAAA
jgi:sugar phosphate isomerase/epimerase